MNTTPDAPVIVVTEERRRRRGLLWVACGAALLLGGSTFALWSASGTFAGGSITAGDLDLVVAADTTFWDVSADREDATVAVPGTDGSQKGHALNPADASTWRIVPGDKVAASLSADVTLEGDNLVAALAITGLSDAARINTKMTYTYEIYQAGVLRVSESPLPTGNGLMFLSAPVTGQAEGQDDATVPPGAPAVTGTVATTSVFGMAATTERFTVVIYGSFASTTTGQDQVGVTDTLAGMGLQLMQTRELGAQFPTPAPTPPAP